MSDFKKICITFCIFKLQKCDVCQNGVEFCHKPIGDDVKPLLPNSISYRRSWTGPMAPSNRKLFHGIEPSMKNIFDGTLGSMVPSRNKLFEGTLGCKVPSNNKLFDGTVPSRKQLFDGTVPSRKQLFDGTVPSNSFSQSLILNFPFLIFNFEL